MNVVVVHLSERLIQQKIETGAYPDAPAVVRAALRVLDERDGLDASRAETRLRLDDMARGDVVDFTSEPMDRLVRESEQNSRDGKPVRDTIKP